VGNRNKGDNIVEADSVIIDLSKNSKDEAYNGSINAMGNSLAIVMVDDGQLIDVNTRQSYGGIEKKEITSKASGKKYTIYEIVQFEFKGLRFPASGFPNGDSAQPGRTTLRLEFNEGGVKYQKYKPVLQIHSDEDEQLTNVPF
jgi:hypothetical protein